MVTGSSVMFPLLFTCPTVSAAESGSLGTDGGMWPGTQKDVGGGSGWAPEGQAGSKRSQSS